MESLYELTNEYTELLAMLEDGEDEEVIKDTLEAISGTMEVKLTNCGAVINRMQSNYEMVTAEIKRLQDIQKRIENGQKVLKKNMLTAMQVADIKKVTIDPRFTISRKKNGGKAPMVITGEVPDYYQKIVYEPDKDRIRRVLEGGDELVFAHLEPRGEHLEVK